MSSLLIRSSRRYLSGHPWLLGLSVLGIMLGVAVVTGIDLANSSARRAFLLSSQTVTGKATHQIVATSAGLHEEVYRKLRVDLGYREAAPVIEGYVNVLVEGLPTLQILGVDPLAEEPFRPYLGGNNRPDLRTFITSAHSIILSKQVAERLGVQPGDTMQVSTGGKAFTLHLGGILDPEDEYSRRALDNLGIVDISTAQILFDMQGRLTRIDLIIPGGNRGQQALRRLNQFLPSQLDIVRSSARSDTIEQMTRAFNLNLTALSLLALVVGMFLIYNTMTFAVVQRRPLLGRLRALGVTRRELVLLIFGEAMAVGLAGTILGLLSGIILGNGLVRLVTQTINDLYFVVSVREAAIQPFTLIKGFFLGLVVTGLAAVLPARAASDTTVSTVLTRSYQEEKILSLIPLLAMIGGVLGLVGLALLFVPVGGIILSYLALLLILLCFSLLTPASIVFFSRLFRPAMGGMFGILGRMASRGVLATLSRTGVATAALMVAVAAAIGVGVMVTSFRATVVRWLDYTLQSDIYIQPPGFIARQVDASVDPEIVRQLRVLPSVASVNTVRTIRTRSSVGAIELAAVEPGQAGAATFQFKGSNPAGVWQSFSRGEAAIVSEPFSFHHRVGAGDIVLLQTDSGVKSIRIAGVYYDYSSDQGVLMLERSVYERLFTDRGYTGIGIEVRPGQQVDKVVEEIRALVRGRQDVVVRSNRALREASLEIFDRTFTITLVLRILALVVAFVGTLSALMALQLERGRELAVLRANGMTPAQVGRYVTLQTGLMGLFAGILSVPLGIVLAMVLIYVINKRSFGWTLQLVIPPEVLVQAVLVAFGAALLAGLYPAWKMANSNPALALREE